ncbi:gamma-interferon-inducible lysosomal thiol reductase-like [Senna tora]|uniref:Gamma-interferon-inducible lysosomal thiol reductase-like n=1 Tax=Senna tora TaxID=362788 RepID=A0A834XIM8_9FABA|nr:gamma-interferon-inducible lysosomal thiol reductase-like [Senna tora]
MASPAFFFCILISLLLHPSHSSLDLSNDSSDGRHGHGHHHHHHHDDYKVNVSLYYEALCPGCEDFIVEDLVKVVYTDLHSIVNLHLVPYGNAQIQTPNKTVICQHGPLECYYNTIEACALDIWPSLKVNFPFIHCVETRLQHKKDKTVWESCCKDFKLNPKLIQNCYNSAHGKQLIMRNAEETGRLSPAHQYVPWVTVNSRPLYLDYTNLTKNICNAYKGHPKPRACKMGTIIPNHNTIKPCLPS